MAENVIQTRAWEDVRQFAALNSLEKPLKVPGNGVCESSHHSYDDEMHLAVPLT